MTRETQSLYAAHVENYSDWVFLLAILMAGLVAAVVWLGSV